MNASRLRAAGLAVAATLGLSACTTYPGMGYGASVGVGNAGYYDPYYDRYGYGYGYPQRYGYGYPAYGGRYGYPYGYGYGYGYPPAGWYNGYYYPGTGHYVYRDGRRQRYDGILDRWRQRNVPNDGTVGVQQVRPQAYRPDVTQNRRSSGVLSRMGTSSGETRSRGRSWERSGGKRRYKPN